MALPKKSIYCPACHRTKLLFETEAKANNFIKFNHDEILRTSCRQHKAPVRSYYCQLCGGFHVTSNPSVATGKLIDERVNERIELAKKFNEDSKRPCNSGRTKIKTVKNCEEKTAFNGKIERANYFALLGKAEEAELILEECDDIVDKFRKLEYDTDPLVRKTDKVRTIISVAATLADLPEKELTDMAANTLETDDTATMKIIAGNIIRVKRLEAMIAKNDQLLSEGRFTAAAKNIDKSQSAMSKINFVSKPFRNEVFGTALKRQQGQIDAHKQRATNKVALAKMKTDMQTYRTTLIAVIDKIGDIQTLFDNGDLYACRTAIEGCYDALNKIGFRDNNTNLVCRHLDSWKEKLESRAPQAC